MLTCAVIGQHRLSANQLESYLSMRAVQQYDAVILQLMPLRTATFTGQVIENLKQQVLRFYIKTRSEGCYAPPALVLCFAQNQPELMMGLTCGDGGTNLWG